MKNLDDYPNLVDVILAATVVFFAAVALSSSLAAFLNDNLRAPF